MLDSIAPYSHSGRNHRFGKCYSRLNMIFDPGQSRHETGKNSPKSTFSCSPPCPTHCQVEAPQCRYRYMDCINQPLLPNQPTITSRACCTRIYAPNPPQHSPATCHFITIPIITTHHFLSLEVPVLVRRLHHRIAQLPCLLISPRLASDSVRTHEPMHSSPRLHIFIVGH